MLNTVRVLALENVHSFVALSMVFNKMWVIQVAHGYHILVFTYRRCSVATLLVSFDIHTEYFGVYIICLREKTDDKAHKFTTTILKSTPNGRSRTRLTSTWLKEQALLRLWNVISR